MPFGLKNVRVTFQCMVDKIFKDLIGRTMKVYVDDMVKSVLRMDHLQHLGEAFDLLWKYKVKLNPEKYTSGVTSGKFLGYLVTQRGIEADPDQIRHLKHEVTYVCERGPHDERMSRCSKLIHQLIYGQMKDFFPILEERDQFPLERKMRDSFPWSEQISGFTSTLI